MTSEPPRHNILQTFIGNSLEQADFFLILSTFIKVNIFGSKIFIMHLATVLTHDITVFNQSHRIAAKIPLRPTWVLDPFGTKDAVDYIIFLDQ